MITLGAFARIRERLPFSTACLLPLGLAAVLAMCSGAAYLRHLGKEEKAPDVNPAINVAVRVVRPEPFIDTVTLPASVKAYNDIQIASEIGGKVVFIAKEGTRVVKNETELLRIDDRDYRTSLEKNEAVLKAVELRYNRLKQLAASRTVSKQELDDTEGKYREAVADVGKCRLDLEKCVIKAPTDGMLNHVSAEVGEWIGIGQTVANLVDDAHVKVYAWVPEKDIAFVAKGDEVLISWQGPTERKDFTGTLDFVATKAHDRSRTYLIRTVLENPERFFKDGMIVEMRVTRKEIENAIMASMYQIIPRDRGYVMFVEKDGKAEERPVDPKFISSQRVFIASGLHAGDRLIVKGHRQLIGGQEVNVVKVFDE